MFEYLIKIKRNQRPYYSSNRELIQEYEYKKSGTLLSAKREATKQVQNILDNIHLLETKLNGGVSYSVHLDADIYLEESETFGCLSERFWLASQHLSFNPQKERCCNTQDSKWYTTHRGDLQAFREKRFPELSLDSGDLLTEFINLR